MEQNRLKYIMGKRRLGHFSVLDVSLAVGREVGMLHFQFRARYSGGDTYIQL